MDIKELKLEAEAVSKEISDIIIDGNYSIRYLLYQIDYLKKILNTIKQEEKNVQEE